MNYDESRGDNRARKDRYLASRLVVDLQKTLRHALEHNSAAARTALSFVRLSLLPPSHPEMPSLLEETLGKVEPKLWMELAVLEERFEIFTILREKGLVFEALAEDVDQEWDPVGNRFLPLSIGKTEDQREERNTDFLPPTKRDGLLSNLLFDYTQSDGEEVAHLALNYSSLPGLAYSHAPMLGKTSISWLSWCLVHGHFASAERLWEAQGKNLTQEDRWETLVCFLQAKNTSDLLRDACAEEWFDRLVDGVDLTQPIPVRRWVAQALFPAGHSAVQDTKYHLMSLLEKSERGEPVDKMGIVLRALAMGGSPENPTVRPVDLLLAAAERTQASWILQRCAAIDWVNVEPDTGGRFPAFAFVQHFDGGISFGSGYANAWSNAVDPEPWLAMAEKLFAALPPAAASTWWAQTMSQTLSGTHLGSLPIVATILKGTQDWEHSRQIELQLHGFIESRLASEGNRKDQEVLDAWDYVAAAAKNVMPWLAVASTPDAARRWEAHRGLVLARLAGPKPDAQTARGRLAEVALGFKMGTPYERTTPRPRM